MQARKEGGLKALERAINAARSYPGRGGKEGKGGGLGAEASVSRRTEPTKPLLRALLLDLSSPHFVCM